MTTTPSDRIRLLIVDDHPIVRDGLVSILHEGEPDLEVVGEAGDGKEAVEAWRTLRPSVTIMDLQLPGQSGVEAIKAIRREDPEARILVLTTFDGDADIQRALEAGARGYLLKSVRRAILIEAVRAVDAGRRYLPPATAARLVEAMESERLTPRELDVLKLLAEGQRNREIADALGLAEPTVKIHVNNLLRKLQAKDRTEAAVIALKRGLIHLGREGSTTA
ncbi:MAG: response regulator transcription factor [Holophagaceae bacterium]|jgi:two-component system NarL family response regulator|uniref:Response regulator transcription factor n=1 Tax=Candidatus Geothrix odensensis TaxID=2954440 RepID=A0A936K530_9BACT|nr:response regulator transcription factor [Holophagaceae bacterium]MBK8571863.1 response regulator transcription factor [Candidatus Geothrix odensensis]MBK8791517.1 response regulator transcription factor [Holophagaceae bacterium]